MNRTEFVNKVFKTLEENHINLYHDISKEDFNKQKDKFLEIVDKIDQIHFEGGLLKLFALFKDAHVNYWGIDCNYVDASIILVDKDFYIKKDDKFLRIDKVNGYKIKDVVEKLKQLIPYETESWAYHLISTEYIRSPKYMQMIDCGKNADEIEYHCENGEDVMAKFGNKNGKFNEKIPAYESLSMCENKVLYIRYSQCRNIEDYPFTMLIEDIKRELKILPKACLVDVRNNYGGSDVVINPLLQWLKENNIKTYALMNEGTFSSGTFALASLKEETKATLLGTEAGQPTRVYGNIQYHMIDGKGFTSCERYFELTSCHDEKIHIKPFYISNAFNYAGVIKPDVKIKINVNDLNNGVDSQLKQSLEIIENEMYKENENVI